jgi:hypothetical protein
MGEMRTQSVSVPYHRSVCVTCGLTVREIGAPGGLGDGVTKQNEIVSRSDQMMLYYRSTFIFSILLALGFVPLAASFSLIIPKPRTVGSKSPTCQHNVDGMSRILGRLYSTSEAVDRATVSGPRKKDKLTKEAQELLDAFKQRRPSTTPAGEASTGYDLLVAQVAPSVR